MNNREHAIVIGGSMAGLLATRVLSKHFQRVTLLELRERVEHLETEARDAQAELVKQARQFVKAGASHRAVAEALGLPRSTLTRLVETGTSR